MKRQLLRRPGSVASGSRPVAFSAGTFAREGGSINEKVAGAQYPAVPGYYILSLHPDDISGNDPLQRNLGQLSSSAREDRA
jgi:hypothetical protein